MGIWGLIKSCFRVKFPTPTARKRVFRGDTFHPLVPTAGKKKHAKSDAVPKTARLEKAPSANKFKAEDERQSSFLVQRLRNEWKQVQSDPPIRHAICGPIDEDLFTWFGAIIGPSNTPYEGGVFILSIEIPDDYPFMPPKVKFFTKIYHPNINEDGNIDLEILDTEKLWSTALTVQMLVLSICSFLSDPNPEEPQNPVSVLYWNDRKSFNETARSWTKLYARGNAEKLPTFVGA